MGGQELLGKMMEGRVDQIIGERLPGLRARYYEEQEAILRSCLLYTSFCSSNRRWECW